MFLWYPVMDLARAPRRTARKKGLGTRMSPTGEYNKMEIFKTAARVSDKEISEIKMNSDQK
jgi:hypothetical protein